MNVGISLQIKAGIGQSMFNAFSLLFADLFHIEIGTMINIFNLLFFVLYLVMKPSPFNTKDFKQIAATMMNGFVINVFTYSILSQITFPSYSVRVLIFLLGLFLASISLGAILAIGIIKFPLESLCIEITQKYKTGATTPATGKVISFIEFTLSLCSIGASKVVEASAARL